MIAAIFKKIIGSVAGSMIPYLVLAGVVALGGFYIYARHQGVKAERVRWEIAVEKEQKRQRAATDKALEWERVEDQAQRAQIEELEQKVTSYEDELAKRGGDPVLTEPDARRLRDIR